ncbi:MAG: DNA repair protein RecN [Gammaproteobacteria bacterium]|nr:DNA repair protein RecN [Gammaproteobacteria bacterium]
MLTRLAVRDLAVIRTAQIEADTGFTVLTGETGAGKSLLVDALNLVLGSRGTASLVRSGAQRAGVSAEFDWTGNAGIGALLAARDLPGDNPLILHRQIGADGRSRAWINGVPMPLGVLRELGEALVEIHGQHEHLMLARPDRQRLLFDTWAGCLEEAHKVEQAARAVREAHSALRVAREAGQGAAARGDYLKYQLQELDTLAPREGEYTTLFSQYEQIKHREQVTAALARAFEALEEGETPAIALLARAREALSELPQAASLGETAQLLAQAEVLAQEAALNLQRIAETEVDPRELDSLNERIARYQSLARKHAVEPVELHRQREAFASELETLDNSEEHIQALERARADSQEQWSTAAAALSKRRRKGASGFASAITGSARALGMPQADFQVALEPAAADDYAAAGAETIRFEVTTNAGQAPGPLAQVASGGELSRLALAIEVLAHGGSCTPVMVFDEVDAGVSGRVAELVGRELKRLAAGAQVLCVTHLPQVAALADHHYAVSKTGKDGATATRVSSLDDDDRIEAIAAMLAGVKVGESAREHARDLLARAASQ